jgi:hypothetical protein
MRDRGIAKAIVCLVVAGLGGWSAEVPVAAAQDPADEGAPAAVELSLSIAPTALLALGGPQGALAGLGGVGGLGALTTLLTPQLDAGFAIDRATYFVVGVSGSFRDGDQPGYNVAVPLGVLWYLETPRVGRLMPMLRVGVTPYLSHQELPPSVSLAPIESFGAQALVRGGLTWLLDRHFALRAEIGVRGGAGALQVPGTANAVSGFLGFDALVGLVLRV